ncbi:MAG TPA: UDP-N-acetylglucosamine pyrophosphorylase [Clostridiales bacterium]|nr:UDP-N-acetylglucosamine pyrophosphorylase [Clostridiales bacterium]
MEHNIEEIRHTLKKYNQEHLLNFYDNMEESKQNKLLEQIENIDFELIKSLYDKTKDGIKNEDAEIEPIDFMDKYKLNEDYKYYEQIGEKAIRAGKLAVVTMAGGQGTRLGHNGPKGTYDIGLDSHKSLFELLFDYIKEQNEKYNVQIPWFIMTSKENNEATVKFFKDNKYFGYEKNIFFFIQGQLPMIDTEGKILIGEDYLIKEAADGHGGVYESLVKSGMVEKMKQLGVEWVFIGGVDNCLVKMVDPVLMGIAIDKGVTAAGKSVVKANPHEKVGAFCKKNGKPSVVEYSEITDEMAEATDENGELLYGESHILCNLFNISAIERMGSEPLPYHSAFKKATYIDKDGNKIVPTSPNAYKFEAFLFDAFGEVDDMAILRVKREEEFAPVKNATGVDSPETARELYNNFHKKEK